MNNRGAAAIVVIVILAIIGGVSFVLLSMSEKVHDTAKESIQAETNILVNDVVRTGKFSEEQFESFLKKVQASTSLVVDAKIELQTPKENAAKKIQSADGTVSSSDNYVTEYTTNVYDKWKMKGGTITLEPGSRIYIEVTSENKSAKEVLTGREDKIVASSSGVVGK